MNAYIGCVSGAVMKDKYLETMREVGFQEVKAMEEAWFPSECVLDDPTAKVIIEDAEMPAEKIKEIASSIASKVYGIKPK